MRRAPPTMALTHAFTTRAVTSTSQRVEARAPPAPVRANESDGRTMAAPKPTGVRASYAASRNSIRHGPNAPTGNIQVQSYASCSFAARVTGVRHCAAPPAISNATRGVNPVQGWVPSRPLPSTLPSKRSSPRGSGARWKAVQRSTTTRPGCSRTR